MIAVLLLIIPFVFGLLLLASREGNAKKIALAASLVQFAVTLGAWAQFRHNPAVESLSFDQAWISSLGISFSVSLDGISLLLVILTNLLLPLIILSSFKKTYSNARVFYSLVIFMQMALNGVFMAMDGILFYIFWELALIPIYFICLLWGGENRGQITFKFFIYTLLGSLFMLIALIYLQQHTTDHSFAIQSLYKAGAGLSTYAQCWVFSGMFLAFAIKMPVFPFHTWQPDTYVTAPTQGTMLLSGIMLKMGIYGLIRWLVPLVPVGVKECGDIAILLSVIGIVYASCIAIVQKDFKRLIAYSSIAHVGLIAAGVLSVNAQGLQGAMIQMVSHGINVVGLFFIADIIFTKTNTRQINDLAGIRNVAPVFSVLFLIILLGSVALPLTNGFIGEFLLINGIYQYNVWMAAFAGLTVILGAVYMLRSYQSVMLGELNGTTKQFPEPVSTDKLVLVIICGLILAIGVYPKPLLDLTEAPVKEMIERFQMTVK